MQTRQTGGGKIDEEDKENNELKKKNHKKKTINLNNSTLPHHVSENKGKQKFSKHNLKQ